MATITIQLPDDLLADAADAASEAGISLNQYVADALRDCLDADDADDDEDDEDEDHQR